MSRQYLYSCQTVAICPVSMVVWMCFLNSCSISNQTLIKYIKTFSWYCGGASCNKNKLLCSLSFEIYQFSSMSRYSNPLTLFSKSTVLTHVQSHCLACSCPTFDLQQDRNFYFSLDLELGEVMEQNFHLLVSVPNIPGLNPKSLHSAYVVKVYELLIVICLSDGDVKAGGTLGSF